MRQFSLSQRLFFWFLAFGTIPAIVIAVVTTGVAQSALVARIDAWAGDVALRAARAVDQPITEAYSALYRLPAFEDNFANVQLPDDDGLQLTTFLTDFANFQPMFAEVTCLKPLGDEDAGNDGDGNGPAPGTVIVFASSNANRRIGAPQPEFENLPIANAGARPGNFVSAPKRVLDGLSMVTVDGRQFLALRIGAISDEQPYSLVGLIPWQHVLDTLAAVQIGGQPQDATHRCVVETANGTALYVTANAGTDSAENTRSFIVGTAVTDAGWHVKILVARTDVLGAIDHLIVVAVVVVIGAALGAGLIAVFAARWTARPVVVAMSAKNAELKTLNDSLAQSVAEKSTALDEAIAARQDVSDALELAEQARRQLAAQLQLVQHQQHTIEQLSTPAIQIWNRVLLVPLIGNLDRERSQMVMETVLHRVAATQSRIVLVDLTAVDMVDTTSADSLLKLGRAVRLMGADAVFTGIRPEIASTLVSLDVEFAFDTFGILQDGLRHALQTLHV